MTSFQSFEQEEPEDVYFKAAKAIAEADFFLLATGAGFSADSGLAVYRDVANHAVYKKLGLTYPDLADPGLIETEPDLFNGFWLKCANDYRDVQPHEGYHIVKKWKDLLFTSPHEKKFENSEEAKQLLKQISPASEAASVEGTSGATTTKSEYEQQLHKPKLYDNLFKYQVESLSKKYGDSFLEQGSKYGHAPFKGVAGPFFTYTSNVDGHSHRMFKNHEIYEIHGSIDYFQCRNGDDCNEMVWPLPMEKRFNVTEEMTATWEKEKAPIQKTCPKDPKVMYDSFESFSVPICQYCADHARPNILLFGDACWIKHSYPSGAYYAWRHSVEDVIESNPDAKIVIFEVGCGNNVPSVRYQCSGFFEDANQTREGSASFIRVNPELPQYRYHGEETPSGFIGIKSTGLEAIKKIDEHLTTLLQKK